MYSFPVFQFGLDVQFRVDRGRLLDLEQFSGCTKVFYIY